MKVGPCPGRGGGGEQLGLGGGLAVILEQEAYLMVVCVRYCGDIPVGVGQSGACPQRAKCPERLLFSDVSCWPSYYKKVQKSVRVHEAWSLIRRAFPLCRAFWIPREVA